MVSRRLRSICRRGAAKPAKPYVHRDNASDRRRKLRKAIEAQSKWVQRDVHPEHDTERQTYTLDALAGKPLLANNDEAHARFLLDHCLDDIRAMVRGPRYEKATIIDTAAPCDHDIMEDVTGGMDVCVYCGEAFTSIRNEYQWIDGYLAGTHTVQKKHVYDRKTYFETALRNVFIQSRARMPPFAVILWCRQRRCATVNELLRCMKKASKATRRALKLPRYYKSIHAIFSEANNVPINRMRTDKDTRMLHMYDGCLTAFRLIRDKHNRSSFPNTYYVMRQLMILVDHDRALIERVPTMRMRTKIREHDRMWKDICTVQRWAYYPMCPDG